MATQLFTECVVENDMANEAIEFGIRKRWFFRVMEVKGVIKEPILKTGFHYIPIEMDSVKIPDEALRRKEVFEKEFRVKQWIIGHEVVIAPDETEIKPLVNPQWEIKEYEISWTQIAKIALKSVAFLGYGILLALSVVDPCLIAVLDDKEKTWISVCEWEE